MYMVINFCCIQFREAQIHVDVLQVEVLFFFLNNLKKYFDLITRTL